MYGFDAVAAPPLKFSEDEIKMLEAHVPHHLTKF